MYAEYWHHMDHLSAKIALCVGQNGDVTKVALLESSGEKLYDESVLQDAKKWHYDPASTTTGACVPATVTYLP